MNQPASCLEINDVSSEDNTLVHKDDDGNEQLGFTLINLRQRRDRV